MYQSPVAVQIDGEELVFAVTDERVVGLRPHDGEVLWQLAHELSTDPYHGISQPVLVDSASILVNGMTETALFRVAGREDGYRVTESLPEDQVSCREALGGRRGRRHGRCC